MKKIVCLTLLLMSLNGAFAAYTTGHNAVGTIVYKLAPKGLKTVGAITSHAAVDMLVGESYLGQYWWVEELTVAHLQNRIADMNHASKTFKAGSFYGNLFDFVDKTLFTGFTKNLIKTLPFGEYYAWILPDVVGREVFHAFFRIDPVYKMNPAETIMFNLSATVAMDAVFQIFGGDEK